MPNSIIYFFIFVFPSFFFIFKRTKNSVCIHRPTYFTRANFHASLSQKSSRLTPVSICPPTNINGQLSVNTNRKAVSRLGLLSVRGEALHNRYDRAVRVAKVTPARVSRSTTI